MAIREPFEPESVKDWALIIHADSAGERVDVYWADINAGREGLELASRVKAWRRRDDLLTIAHRLRIVIPPENPDSIANATKEVEPSDAAPEPVVPVPSMPREGPTTPGDGRSLDLRHEYLAGRVRALIEHSETAKQALARAWPQGVSGLRNDGQSWEQLDLILDAVIRVEKDHSVPFYPEFVDPNIEEAKREHPSNVWARPKIEQSTPDDRNHIQEAIMVHPRSALLRRWIGYAITGGIDHNIDTTALAHALSEFASISETEWPDDDLTQMLDGSLRALGYMGGCEELGKFNPEHAPLLMSAAFAITAGNAILLFDAETGKPIVRTNVRKG
jgi:hypothetical protein